MRPLIGVTTSEMRPSGLATLRRHGEPPQHEMALGLTYMRAVELAGGVPVVLPPLHDGHAAGQLDGPHVGQPERHLVLRRLPVSAQGRKVTTPDLRGRDADERGHRTNVGH